MAQATQIAMGSAYFTDNTTVLQQIRLTHTGTSNVSISGLILTWDPPTNPNTTETVAINGTPKWLAAPSNLPHSSGSVLTFSTPYTLTPGSTDIPLTLTFDQNMVGKTIAVVLQFADGSSRSAIYTPDNSQAAALNVDVTSAGSANGSKKEIQNIVVTNTHVSDTVSITHMTVTWIYHDPVVQMERIRFDNSTVWTGGSQSGTQVTAPRSIAPGASDILELRFDNNMDYSQAEILFTLSDGSTKTAIVDFRIDQASYLDVDMSGAAINGNTLAGMTLKNTHSDAKIWIDRISIGVSPNSMQRIDNIQIGNTTVFDSADTPDDLETLLDVDLTEIAASPMTHEIQFSTLASSHDFGITYLMRDGSSKTVTRNFVSEGLSAASLRGNTANITIKTSLDQMLNLAVSKNGTAPVVFQHMQISWTPLGTLKLKSIHVDGTRLFQNNSGVASGTQVTLTSAKTLTSSDTDIELTFTGGSAADRDISITFVFPDGSTKSFTAFLNPGNSSIWIAADNFEANLGVNGGSGFAAAWTISDTAGNTFQSGGNSYSGNRHMRLRHSHTATRTLTNAATTTQRKVTYSIRLNGYDSGESAYFETRKNGTGPWTTVRTVTVPTLSNGTFYRVTDTMALTIGQKFEIRFRGAANMSNEYLYIDEIFFHD